VTTGYVFAEDAVRDAASAYGAPFLHAITSEYLAHAVAEDWTNHATIFQTSPTERHYGLGFVRAITDIRRSRRWRPANRRLVFVESSLPSSQMINDITIDAADRWGWEIAADPLIVDAGVDWDQVVAAIDRLDPAAVMVAQFLAREVVSFAIASAKADVPWLRYAVYAPSVPEFLHAAGDAAESMLWSTVTGTYGDAIGRAFEADYTRSYAIAPGRAHAGISYDQIMLLGQAFGAVGDPGDHTAVSAHIRRSRMRGVNGSYFLDNPAQCALGYPDLTPDPSLGQAHLIFQVQQGRSRIIAPSPYAEASYQAPTSRHTV
jgi:branched-chain amino acid transport system substrate-binding protein